MAWERAQGKGSNFGKPLGRVLVEAMEVIKASEE
jgi:hypothetical protein